MNRSRGARLAARLATFALAAGALALAHAVTARAQSGAAAGEPGAGTGERITLNLRDAAVSDVLGAVASRFDLDLVLQGGGDRTVSVSLTDRTLEEALEEVLVGSDLAWIRSGRTLRVLPGSMSADLAFRLDNASASRMAQLIKEISQEASVVGDDATNLVFVTADAKTLQRVASFIRSADRPGRQVSIRSRLMEVTLRDETAWGIDWDGIFRDGDVTVSGSTALAPGGTPGTLVRLLVSGEDGDINSIVRHIAERTNGRLLSNPEIVTSNREPAKILVGERVPYQKATTETQTGSTLQEIEFVDVGVKLEVTPQISSGDEVGLQVSVEISEVLDQLVAGTPRIGTREAHTRVTLRSGETLLIGGLVRSSLSKDRSAVPLLGSIPGIGRAFRYEAEREERTELVILVSPEIVGDAAIARAARWGDALDREVPGRAEPAPIPGAQPPGGD